MATKVMKNRHVGGVEYFRCPECEKTEMVNKPIKLKLPYCSDCSRPVEDLAHNYCGHCGVRFED